MKKDSYVQISEDRQPYCLISKRMIQDPDISLSSKGVILCLLGYDDINDIEEKLNEIINDNKKTEQVKEELLNEGYLFYKENVLMFNDKENLDEIEYPLAVVSKIAEECHKRVLNTMMTMYKKNV
jgi:hypothetical protein